MRRLMLVCSPLAVFLVCLVGVTPSSALAAAPTVTLTAPANGALITGGQPTFSGAAGNRPTDSGSVAINVYAGTSASGLPSAVEHATVTNGGYRAVAVGLSDGTYTAVASEPDTAGNVGSSQPVSFSVFNGTPGLTLAAPAAPIRTAAPTFTGMAETEPGDAQSVQLIIYPGGSTNATPLAVLSGAVATNGTFSIQVTPGLVSGTYTAVTAQALVLSTTFSPAVTFTIASIPPPLTVTSPSRADPVAPQSDVTFAGAAGTDYGDSNVFLTLYRGSTTTGSPLGMATVTPNGASWSHQWTPQLSRGKYTLVATQENAVDQESTVTRTFTVEAPGAVTGAVTISAAGKVTARLSCLAGAGTCAGDVLIVTSTALSPSYGGPHGPLDLMFDHFSVPAAKSVSLTAQLTKPQLNALRRAGSTKLVVTVAYSLGSKLAESSRTTDKVTVG